MRSYNPFYTILQHKNGTFSVNYQKSIPDTTEFSEINKIFNIDILIEQKGKPNEIITIKTPLFKTARMPI